MVRGQGAANGMNGVAKADIASPLDIEADEVRSREIAAKGVTGIIMLLLKWFKLSREVASLSYDINANKLQMCSSLNTLLNCYWMPTICHLS